MTRTKQTARRSCGYVAPRRRAADVDVDVPARKRPRAAEATDDDDEQEDAAAESTPVHTSDVHVTCAQATECEICDEALESSEAAGAGAAAALRSRLPRLLPCGHSLCTSCIQKGLDTNRGSVGLRAGAKGCEGDVAANGVSAD